MFINIYINIKCQSKDECMQRLEEFKKNYENAPLEYEIDFDIDDEDC